MSENHTGSQGWGFVVYTPTETVPQTHNSLHPVVPADRDDLRQQLAQRQQEKAELERQLHALRRRYAEEVAPLEEEVLRRKMEHLRRTAQRHMRSATHRNAYHDAQREYEAFRQQRPRAAPAEPEEVRAQYRAASKRCHPDVVSGTYRSQAAAIFQALDSAYRAGHTQAVRAIAESLDRWGFPASESDETEVPIRELQRAVAKLEEAIATIRASEAYQAMGDGDDLEAVLRARTEALRRVLRELKTA